MVKGGGTNSLLIPREPERGFVPEGGKVLGNGAYSHGVIMCTSGAPQNSISLSLRS